MITVFWDTFGVTLVDFIEKGQTANSSSYQNTLMKLSHATKRKRPHLTNVVLHHDNARPHVAHTTAAAIEDKV